MSASPRVAIPRPARGAFRAVQVVSRSLAARLAERWFFAPPRRPVPPEVAAFLQSGRRFALEVDGRPVIGWEWGSGPAVYLVHGWGGLGGRLHAFAAPLLELGYRVVAFDAPGHGASGSGLSSVPEFARALRAVAERCGPAHGVIAHSLGAAAAALAVRWGLGAERFALLAPAAHPVAFAESFGKALGAKPDVMTRMRANSERRLRFQWTELDVCAVAPRMSAPLLVVHDHGDEVVPFSQGAAIASAWPGARLVTTNGLGHYGVTRDGGIVSQVVRFIAEVRSAWGYDETARLERALFDRHTRWSGAAIGA